MPGKVSSSNAEKQINTKIIGYCRMNSNRIILNDETIFENQVAGFSDYIKEVYYHFDMNYPKFFKMDNPSKIGFVAAELLLKESEEIKILAPANVGVLLSNSASSIDTDRKHCDSIHDQENYFPSPSIFVYTLPNIVIGEICIRNNFKGENNFLIFEKFESKIICEEVNHWIEKDMCKACITGWVNFENEQHDVLMCLVEKSDDPFYLDFTSQNLENIYTKHSYTC